MKILIIYAHPYEGSFNNAILETTQSSLASSTHDYEIIDLNKEGFNPVLRKEELKIYPQGKFLDPQVGEYLKKLKAAAHLVFIFPIWWGGVPAILKGFFDKVFLKKETYEFKGLRPVAKLKGKSATVISTMNSPKIFYSFYLKSPVKQTVIKSTLKLCGVKKVKWFELARVVSVSDKKRKKMLAKIRKYFSKL